jgi:hypothetical protein
LSRAERLAIREEQRQARYRQARWATWDTLHRYHPERHSAILRGAMVSALLSGGSDAAVWQAGEKTTDGRLPGMGHKAVAALREVGLLESIRESERGLLRDVETAVVQDTDYAIVHIRDASFYHYRQEGQKEGVTGAVNSAVVSQGERRRARQSLAESAPTAYRDMRLHIKEESGQKVAYTAAGERVGVVSAQTSATLADGQGVMLRYALGRSGDLQAVVTW